MSYLSVKLIQDGNLKAPYRGGIFKSDIDENAPIDFLIRTAAKKIPCDCVDISLLVNGPMRPLWAVIKLCFLREIDLTLVYPDKSMHINESSVEVLRYWTCARCRGRYPEIYQQCPHCGGIGFRLSRDPENEISQEALDKLIEIQSSKS